DPARPVHVADVVHRQDGGLLVPVRPARPLDGRADPDDRPAHAGAGSGPGGASAGGSISSSAASISSSIVRRGPLNHFFAEVCHQIVTAVTTIRNTIGA